MQRQVEGLRENGLADDARDQAGLNIAFQGTLRFPSSGFGAGMPNPTLFAKKPNIVMQALVSITGC